MSKVLSLSKKEREQGLVAASTGNHGLGVARAAAETGAKCTIFVPDNAAPSKVKAIKQYGAEIQYTKAGLSESISHNQARQYAKKRGMAWISPYNDLQVIAGQGTIGIELVGQLSDIDAVFVTVGGGGLISGIATYLRAVSPKTKIIGCLPENSAEMYHSVQAGRFATEESKETLSDGSAGGFEKDSVTFPLCQKLVDDWVLVSEDEIKHAIRLVLDEHHRAIEGSAGVAVAAYLKHKNTVGAYKNVVIVICGGNIATPTLRDILS